MIGKQVIKVNRSFTLDELLEFMNEKWDVQTYNQFKKGKPTPAAIEEYILLPATPNYMVCVYARKAGGLFSKENKVILIVADTPEGVKTEIIESLKSSNAIFGAMKIGLVMTKEKERKGPAEDALQFYTKYMKELLENEGYLE